MLRDFHALTIREVKRETSDAISVTFDVPEPLREAFRFQPGQHLTLRTHLNGEDVRRNYSICAGPRDPMRIAIKRLAGGFFSCWANETLKAGTVIDVMPPQGRFVLPPGDGSPRHVVAFAAGAGITPIVGLLKQALLHEPATHFTLVYGNRTPQSILFREELEDLKDRHIGRFTLLHVLSRNDESSTPLLEGRINAEKVKVLSARLFPPEHVAHVFLCGPGSMIKETRNVLFALGFARDRVHHEFFAPGGGTFRKVPVGTAAAAPVAQQEGAEVVAILDGIRHNFIVPQGLQVVDAALAAGIRVPYACKGGMCCTCRARLVEGRAEMLVNYSLEPWEIERGFILTCQAVPKSERLVLDYDQM
jgi:ring-1,2-phenylacetyl-CoA epoxidase subunit PaaE